MADVILDWSATRGDRSVGTGRRSNFGVAATEQDGGWGIQVTAAVMSGTRAKPDERLRLP